MTNKEKLINDIQNLLNSYEGTSITTINVNLLEFMSESDLKEIVDSLLSQKENTVSNNEEWLKQFKKTSF